MSADLDLNSWEVIQLNLNLPTNTTYVGIAISATSPFDRQYADDVMVTLTGAIVRSKADFLSLVSDVVTEGFEGFPTELNCSSGGSSPSSSISTPLMTVSTSPTGGGTSFLCIGTTPGDFPGPTEGSNALVAGSNTGDPWILTFSLTDAVKAVWFELTDAVESGDAFISIDGLGEILVASQGSGGVNTVVFGIITDDPFTEFSLINTGFSDGWGVDQIMLALASPFPVCSSIVTTIDGLKAEVDALNTSTATIDDLNLKLDKVLRALDSGKNEKARSGMESFIQMVVKRSNVEATNPDSIPLDEANSLICSASNVLLNIPLP